MINVNDNEPRIMGIEHIQNNYEEVSNGNYNEIEELSGVNGANILSVPWLLSRFIMVHHASGNG